MTLTLDAAARAQILDFVRPLSVGLDGVTNFGFVERRLRISANFLEGEEGRSGAAGVRIDRDLLFLLAAFAGLPSARRITSDGRESLLLRSLHIPEEMIVHDAMLLESVGAYGVTQLLVAGARERMTLTEMAREIAEKMAAAHFTTETGRRLAADRVAFATLFAKKLAEEAAEFEAAPSPA